MTLRKSVASAVTLLVCASFVGCSGAGTTLPENTAIGTGVSQPIVRSVQGRTAGKHTASTSSYTYTAPWGGFGTPQQIYVLPQSPCSYIPATQGSGFSWPSFLQTLASGTQITLSGTPSFPDGWSQANQCPTGGIVVTAISIGASASSSPTPSPTAPPGASGGDFPIYSKLFTAGNNPFHMTVASLTSLGAQRQSQTLMNNLWSQGYYSEGEGSVPIYSGRSGQSSYVVGCSYYSSRGCNAQGIAVHLPAGAAPSNGSDHHIVSVDLAAQGEFDGWGGAGGWQSCYPGGSSLNCTWGGWYPFSGKGLQNSGNNGNHGGYAFGLFAITAQEILNGRIDHALGLATACLDNPSVYPATTINGSDYTCSGGGGASPSAGYGQLVHLRWNQGQISSSAYSQPCKTVLTALATYGAYTYDDGNGGLQILTDDPQSYGSRNPWFDTIYPQLAAAGDGRGSGAGFGWSSCLNRLSAGDFEIFTIPNLGY